MYTKRRYNFGFFIIILPLFFISCSGHQLLYSKTQKPAPMEVIVTSCKAPVPLIVRKYLDTTGNTVCQNIPANSFRDASSHFNPGFYKGVLWLDVFFPNTIPQLGSEYVVDFGTESYNLIEVYAPSNGSWVLYGRTGRSLNRAQMSSPSWRQNIPLNEAELETNMVHHIRIRMYSPTATPVNIKITPRRSFDYQTSWFSIICYLLGGFFIIGIFVLFIYGLIFKDKVYLLLSGSSFCLLLSLVEIKGIGPVYIWNAIAPIVRCPNTTFFFANSALILLFTAFLFLIYENKEIVKGKKTLIAMYVIAFTAFICSIIIASTTIVYFIMILSIITNLFLFTILILINKVGRRKDIHFMLTSWIIMFTIVTVRQLFHILRIFYDSKFFMLFDNENFLSLDVVFVFLTVPPLYIMGTRLSRRFVLMQSRLSALSKQTSDMRYDKHFYFTITHELLNLQNVLQNAVNTPFRGDTAEEKETKFLIKKASTRSLDLLNALCLFETGTLIDSKPILLLPFFNGCVNAVEPFATERGNTLSVTGAVSNDCVVYANTNILELIFADFITTVVKYSPHDSRIVIVLSAENDTVICSAKNKAKHTESKNARLLFDIDYPSHYYEDEGTSWGLGFHLIQEAAKLYNGSVDITTLSDGYAFDVKIKLPQASADMTKAPAIIDCSQVSFIREHKDSIKSSHTITDSIFSSDGQTPTIMLVEDNFENGTLITEQLEGHAILTRAINGMEAWNALNTCRMKGTLPDLIICEYDLPILSGAELFRKCKQESTLQDIPFIFLISVTDYRKKQDIIERGAVDCIFKPFTNAELFTRIYSLFTIRSLVHHAVLSRISNMVQVSTAATVSKSEKELPSPKNTVTPKRSTMSLTPTQQTLFASYSLSTREQQIALLISEGKSDKQIADELAISAATVATHNKKLFKKLDVHSRVELMNKVR